ncbi:tissue factor pathway inhibitor a isoform X2 [Lepisosteus oculatus]|uniref:Tissue factor pathway inhibitor n=1 Tax=Lepisosteus oculatus TaxID=7918 RepID=W5MG64_LEPOC|nr:PREDICTED: tissue factor pathway inhibitor isoform X2 [Lepisosteus oculatus]
MFSFKAVLIICILHVSSCYSESDVQITDGVLRELKIFHHSCALKMDEGPCKASKLSFYFNINTHKCETFLYGGCLGNANNFETLAECEEKCLVTPDKNPCHLEEEPGPCRGVLTRYFFNSSAQKCDRMIYGGCFGNANNFKTLKECQATCHKKKPHTVEDSDKHTDIPEPNIIPVIYFDLTTVNSSSPELDSRHADLDRPGFCWSRPDRGTCDGSVKRYLFNPKKMRCHAFRYSGCGGNKNNFVFKEDCRKTCMKGVPITGRIRIKKKNIKILVKP